MTMGSCGRCEGFRKRKKNREATGSKETKLKPQLAALYREWLRQDDAKRAAADAAGEVFQEEKENDEDSDDEDPDAPHDDNYDDKTIWPNREALEREINARKAQGRRMRRDSPRSIVTAIAALRRDDRAVKRGGKDKKKSKSKK